MAWLTTKGVGTGLAVSRFSKTLAVLLVLIAAGVAVSSTVTDMPVC